MSSWRIFVGFLIAGIALGGAVWLHSGYKADLYLDTFHRKAAWQDPLAVVLAFAGVGAGVVLIASGFRRPASD